MRVYDTREQIDRFAAKYSEGFLHTADIALEQILIDALG
jgi:hypothetical protein